MDSKAAGRSFWAAPAESSPFLAGQSFAVGMKGQVLTLVRVGD
jgi:hypothetical protein